MAVCRQAIGNGVDRKSGLGDLLGPNSVDSPHLEEGTPMRLNSHRMIRHSGLLLGLLALLPAVPGFAQQQAKEDHIVRSSAALLQSMLRDPDFGVPAPVIRGSQGVILFPNMLQVGFIGGARHGRGIVMVRDTMTGEWSNPFFITLTGGNVGLQIGASSSELLLVFQERATIERFLLGQGKMTLGVDASAAAGPIGAGVGGETDPRFKADMMTYSRGKGLYAGAVVGGSVATVDHRADWAYYTAPVTPSEILANSNKEMVVPASADQLRHILATAGAPVAKRPAVKPVTDEAAPDADGPVILDSQPDSLRFP